MSQVILIAHNKQTRDCSCEIAYPELVLSRQDLTRTKKLLGLIFNPDLSCSANPENMIKQDVDPIPER